jgi:hypothetical protein
MTDLLYHHVKIKEGWGEPKEVKDYFIQRNKEIEEHMKKENNKP